MIRLLSRVLTAALCISIICIAAQNAAAQTGKIVWLNLEQAVLSCEEGKNELTDIQQFVDEKNAELSNKKKEFDSLKNQLSVQGSKLTDEARADLQFQITTKEAELQRFQQDTQQTINFKKDRIAAYILKRMQPVIDKTARNQGYAAILNMEPNRDIWIDETLNITDEIVKAYNATYPVVTAKEPPTP